MRSVSPDPSKQFGQDAAHGRTDDPDHQVSGFTLSDARCFPGRPVEIFQNARGPRPENLSCGRQADAAVCAFDKLNSQFGFELLDLMAESRLGDIQQKGGFGEMELLRKHAEVAEVPYFHLGQIIAATGPPPNASNQQRLRSVGTPGVRLLD